MAVYSSGFGASAESTVKHLQSPPFLRSGNCVDPVNRVESWTVTKATKSDPKSLGRVLRARAQGFLGELFKL